MSENKQPQKSSRPHGGPGGPGANMLQGPKAKDFKGTMKKLIAYMGKHKWTILFVWIVTICATVFTVVGPKILGNATDELFTGLMAKFAGTGNIEFSKIAGILLWVLGLYVFSVCLSYIQGFVMANVTQKITYQLRKDLDLKIHKLPLKYYDKTTNGEVLSRFTNDVDTISQSLSQSMNQIISSVTGLIGMIIMMLSISWQLTLIALCILPLSMVFVGLIIKQSQKHFKNQQKYLGHVNGQVEEMYSSHVIVKAFNGEVAAAEAFEKDNDMLYKSAWKANFLSGLMMPITAFISNLGYVAVCLMGGYFAVNGTLTVGGIQSFVQYVRQFTQPISQLAQISNVLQQTAAAAERVFEFLGQEEELADAKDAIALSHKAHEHKGSDVTFQNVNFGYEEGQPVIKDFSAHILPGQKVAIVGPTGAGKTTIMKLLMRFYDVTGGAILVDANDIRHVERDELRTLFGMVLQDTWLFNGTVADNIRYGKLDATDEEVKEAAKAAQVHQFVRTLPDKYNMVLNEEASNVSQGQKQLLTIARAILADPEILILDEATSSVDTRTEVLIQKAMDNLMKGRTSFVIAHRLSTIRDADLILVMDQGNIIEQGNHEELLASGGFYANLYNSQFDMGEE